MANIVFVDEHDNVIGAGTMQEASQKGIAHRIARIFVFNSRGQLLLQKRSPAMFLAPNKWDDSSAGHVDEGEEYLEAAERELKEELGIVGVELELVAKFYTESVESGDNIVRKRFHTLYRCTYDGEIKFDPHEVGEVQWFDIPYIEQWVQEKPDNFAGGFRTAFAEYQKAHK